MHKVLLECQSQYVLADKDVRSLVSAHRSLSNGYSVLGRRHHNPPTIEHSLYICSFRQYDRCFNLVGLSRAARAIRNDSAALNYKLSRRTFTELRKWRM